MASTLPPTVKELKKELHRLVTAILDEEDCSLEFLDEAVKILNAFMQFKLGDSFNSLKLVEDVNVVPNDFKCPISGELMSDPVVISSGQTYDRVSIQENDDGLSETVIIPNFLVREMISRWCKEHGVELPNPASHPDDNVTIDANRSFLNSLIDKLSSSTLSDQIDASKQLRVLTKKNPKTRIILGELTMGITRLVLPLANSDPGSQPDLQENLITAILNISIPDENKAIVAENPLIMPILIDALEVGNMETRSNAAAAFFTLSAIDSNKILIGKSGAFKPLIVLVGKGNQRAAKDAAAAIYNLCIATENREIAVHEGAVRVMFRKMLDGILVDELTTIIAMLANYPQAIAEMLELNAIYYLLRLLRYENTAHNKENFVVILYAICLNERSVLSNIRNEENAYQTISKLAKDGSLRAKRKAEGILKWLDKAVVLTDTT
ncbi:U-box domain-containing protein 9-like [Euphorbia lathyris]|uniref:U-box domain-containing protein 9-like n=1 Tax=Euphorbia lathyris TaxID=212925 RepID=UPI003313A8B1